MRYPDDLESVGRAVLAAGHVPGPPAPPYAPGIGYPLAFDVCGRIAAVSFAALDVYPDIASGWWCLVEQFSLRDGAWESAGGEYDQTTTPTPFERPVSVDNGRVDWLDWGINGGWGEWRRQPVRPRQGSEVRVNMWQRLPSRVVIVSFGGEPVGRVTNR